MSGFLEALNLIEAYSRKQLAHHGMSSFNLPCPLRQPGAPLLTVQAGSIDKHLLKLCKLDSRSGVAANALAFCDDREI
jgi:hypothetical protein